MTNPELRLVMETSPAETPRSAAVWSVLAGAFCAGLCLVAWLISRDKELSRDIVHGVLSIVTTPFFMEATVFFIGISFVVLWNAWRRKKEGDGWVFLAEDEPHKRAGESTGKHDAIFTNKPEPSPEHLDLTVIEGLIELGAWKEVGEELLALSPEELESPAGLRCRWHLANGLGQTAHASELAARLTALGHLVPPLSR